MSHLNNETATAIRLLTVDDVPFAMELKNAAGWNQVEADWEGYMAFEPEGCFLAEVNGAQAGTATTISYEKSFSWIGMVLVHPNSRKLGVGTALLKKSIAYLQQKGVRCIKLDATQMGRNVYIPLGFADEYEVVRYQLNYPGGVHLEAGSYEISPITISDLESVASFDADYFGANRRQVLDRLHQRAPEFSFMIKNGGSIAGYIMAHKGYEAVQIGPWVAKDGQTADELLRRLLSGIGNSRIFLDVPCPNPSAIQLMEKYSFTVQRGFWRMFLGENRSPGIPECIYASSGAEKG